jgi:RHS repeat-associated protein
MLLTLVMSGAALGQGASSKFEPAPNAIGWDRYVVTLTLQPGEELEAMARQLAGTYRGRLEPLARSGFTGFAVSMSEASARLLSEDAHVVLVQGVDRATTATAEARSELGGSRQTAGHPAAPAAGVVAPAAPALAVNLQPRTNDVGSSWSTGTYTYDQSGNITAIGTELGYGYDRLGRVTTGTAGTGRQQSYTYDRYGNIKTITTTSGGTTSIVDVGVVAATNQASDSVGPTPPAGSGPRSLAYGTYDAAGNVKTWSTGESFEYDGLGMVREATLDGAKTLYIYSASDERIATISLTNGTEIASSWTIRDLSGKVLRRLDKTGAGSAGTWAWKEDYIYRGTQLLAAETDGPEHTLHFHPDHLGTPRLITGNGGAKVSLHTYYAFGQEATSDSQDNERLKFTGHERDTPRLDYMHARYYSPSWGRFLSVDPAMDVKKNLPEPQRWNRYVYATNNPLKYSDPDGRERLQRYHFANVPTHSDPDDSGWALPLRVAGVMFGGVMGKAALGAVTRQFTLMQIARTIGIAETAGVSAAGLAKLAQSGGPTVRIVTNLTRAPEEGRALSAAGGDAAKALANAARSGDGVRTFSAAIPKALIDGLQQAGLLRISQTEMNGVRAVEYRFSPAAAEYVTKFFREVK